MKQYVGIGIAGMGAGILNGLFGAGGGLVMVPILSALTDLEQQDMFAISVVTLLPVCVISLLFSTGWGQFFLLQALPYLLGSATGGILAATLGKKIPTLWLHRTLGLLILWGGIRYLW